jgi:hypothetical protein
MTMSIAPVVFTSDNACHQHARRLVDRHAKDYSGPMKHIIRIMAPVVKQYARAHKARRGEVFPVMRRSYEELRACPSVIHADIRAHHTSRLSANESYEIGYMQSAHIDQAKRAVEIMYGRIHMNRKSLQITLGATNFILTEHAISRFMQRERKAPEEMFSQLVPAIHLSYSLGLAVLGRDRNELALPLGDGMLLGRAFWYEAKENEEIVEVVYRVDGDSARDGEIVERRGPLTRCTPSFEMSTYLSADDLMGIKEAVRNEIGQYYAGNADMLRDIFENMLLRRETKTTIDGMLACMREGKALVKGPLWDRYLSQREQAGRMKIS